MSSPASTSPFSSSIGAGWARERLWLGVSNVGFWVVLSVFALVVGAPSFGLGAWDGVVLLVLYLLVQAPFDVVGGWWLQRRHDRGALPFATFAGRWLRGVAVQALLFGASGATALALYPVGGTAAVLVAGLVAMVLLLGIQAIYLRISTGLRPRLTTPEEARLAHAAGLDPRELRIVDAQDSGFVGGWLGLPGVETLVVPAAWRDTLTDPEWVAQVRRRMLTRHSGQRLLGVAVALLWNLSGLGGALWLFGTADLDGLVRVFATYTLWSFVAVLVLPTISRWGVYAIDRAAVYAGTDPAVLARTIRRLDGLQDDEPDRPEVVESIFHPVPAATNRIAAVNEDRASRPGAWHAARMSLLLSQVLVSPLSRAVHCNIGRPELWAVYPGD